jgi:hypothetical protein
MSLNWCQGPARNYIDKAIQTDRLCSQLHTGQELSVKTSSDTSAHSSCIHSSTAHSPKSLRDSADTMEHPFAMDALPLTFSDCRPAQLGPSWSPTTSRRPHSQLFYSRPNIKLRPLPVQRIVSLPEMFASGTPLDAGKTDQEIARTMRVVSLPEHEHDKGSPATASIEKSLSFDSHDFSLDTPFHSSRQGSIHDKIHPSSLPQTPSPPSSPESILITDKNDHAPESYIRQSIYQCSPSHRDDDGGAPNLPLRILYQLLS